VKLAEAVTIWCAAGRQVERDGRDEDDEHCQRRSRSPPGRSGGDQRDRAAEFAEGEKKREWRHENTRHAEFAQRLARACTIEKLRHSCDKKH
jgi:hypothetical protein